MRAEMRSTSVCGPRQWPTDPTEAAGRPGFARPPCSATSYLRRLVAVNILVDSTRMRTAVAAPGLRGVALLVCRREDDPALDDVGRRCVLVLRRLARICALDGVTPVRPGPEGEASETCDRQVIASERHRAIVELLEVPVRARIGDLHGGCPTDAPITRRRGEDVERRHGPAIRAVADRPDRRIARVGAAVPPECVEDTPVRRDVWEDLMAYRLVVE